MEPFFASLITLEFLYRFINVWRIFLYNLWIAKHSLFKSLEKMVNTLFFGFLLSGFSKSIFKMHPGSSSFCVVSSLSEDAFPSDINSAYAKYCVLKNAHNLSSSSSVNTLSPSNQKYLGPWTPDNPPQKLFPFGRFYF